MKETVGSLECTRMWSSSFWHDISKQSTKTKLINWEKFKVSTLFSVRMRNTQVFALPKTKTPFKLHFKFFSRSFWFVSSFEDGFSIFHPPDRPFHNFRASESFDRCLGPLDVGLKLRKGRSGRSQSVSLTFFLSLI